MKEWALTLILLSLFALLIKNLFPKKNAALGFLLSLCTLVVLFSPIIRFKDADLDDFDFFEFLSPEAYQIPKGEELILQRLSQDLEETLKKAFPQGHFTLEIYTDENSVPTEIHVVGNDPVLIQNAADYIKIRYGISAQAKEKGG